MLRLLPPLCWTGLIAYFGGSQWSTDQTAGWLGPLLSALLPFGSPEQLEAAHFLIRKAAHIIEYGVLAGLWRGCLGGLWVPLGLAMLTATLDELHQSFAPGRGAAVADVLLDGAAAVIALAVIEARRRPRDATS